jgi:hypothetical protein
MNVALTSHPYWNTTVGMSPMSAAGGSRSSAAPACMMTATHQRPSTSIPAGSSALPVISEEMQSVWSVSMRKA